MFFPSKQKRLKNWEATRERGMWRFILVNGIIGWGLTTAVLGLFIMSFVTPGFNTKTNISQALIIFPLGGILWGWLVWRHLEKELKNSKDTGIENA